MQGKLPHRNGELTEEVQFRDKNSEGRGGRKEKKRGKKIFESRGWFFCKGSESQKEKAKPC